MGRQDTKFPKLRELFFIESVFFLKNRSATYATLHRVTHYLVPKILSPASPKPGMM